MFVDVAQHLLERGDGIRFRAEGTSMLPTIQDGDVLTVAAVESGAIALGDIILYSHRGRPIAHRVAEIRRSPGTTRMVFVACGDGKTACDAPIEPRQILGKVVSIERCVKPRTRAAVLARVLYLHVARLNVLYRHFVLEICQSIR